MKRIDRLRCDSKMTDFILCFESNLNRTALLTAPNLICSIGGGESYDESRSENSFNAEDLTVDRLDSWPLKLHEDLQTENLKSNWDNDRCSVN